MDKMTNMKDTIKGIIIGVVSSLIASGIIYGTTEKFLWNIQLPLWGWLVLEIPMFIHGNSNEIGKGNIVFMDMKRQK